MDNYEKRLYEIDLLRLFAAASVLLFHYTFRGFAANNMTVLSFPFMGYFFKYGFMGFHLFFIISGFVIVLSAIDKDVIKFLISRIVRLYPAYWVCVSITFIAILIIGQPRWDADFFDYLTNLTMIHGYLGVKSIDGVYWTLMVELRFYFLIFILLFFRQNKNIRYFLGFWLLITLLCYIFPNRLLCNFFLTRWSHYFIAGAGFCIIYIYGINFYNVLIIAVSYIISIYSLYLKIIPIEKNYNTDFSFLVVLIIITICFSIFWFISTKKTKWLNKKIFYKFGLLTYPLYLLHQKLGYMAFNRLNEYFNKYFIFFFVTSIMFFLAYLINKYIEQNFAPLFRDTLSVLTKFSIDKKKSFD